MKPQSQSRAAAFINGSYLFFQILVYNSFDVLLKNWYHRVLLCKCIVDCRNNCIVKNIFL